MEISKKEALEDFEARLVTDMPEAEDLVNKLRRADLTLTRIEPADPGATQPGVSRTWLLVWKPSDSLCDRFDLAPELLMVLTSWRETQARVIQTAEQALRRDLRVDRGTVIVLARDEDAETKLAHSIRHTGRQYIVLSFAQVSQVVDPQRWLRELLLERIGASDLFASGPPVFGWDFVGRDHELKAIRGRLLAGRPVGLYGLRKVGKTSILLKLIHQLTDDADAGQGNIVALPIHLDLLGMSFAEQNRAGFMRYLLRSIHEALETTGLDPTVLDLPPSFTDRKRLGQLDAQDVERLVPEALECLIDWARHHPSRPPILLFIDEYERMLSGNVFPQAVGLSILDYLRGLVQRYQGLFNFLIAGIDRRLAATPRFRSRQNPLFDFVVDFPLGGLEQREMNELFRKIGRRLSLRFEQDALDAIWAETGGHPYLARELGRVIDRSVPPAERQPKVIGAAAIRRHRHEFQQRVSTTMEEISAAVSDLDPHALDALAYITMYSDEADESLDRLRPEVVDTLRGYGVLKDHDGNGDPIRIGCFSAWLQENQPIAQKALAHA